MISLTLKDVADKEHLTIRTLYTVVNVLRECRVKEWRGYVFEHNGTRWVAHAVEDPSWEAFANSWDEDDDPLDL